MGLSEDVKAKLQKQIAYYFSNANLMTDNFLLPLVKESEEGWVKIETFTKFNKIKAITEDVEQLENALENLEGFNIDKEKHTIRRLEPLPEKWEPLPRTLTAQGFPENEDLDNITNFFGEHGKVLRVQKRYYGNPNADGSRKEKPYVFVEFNTEEEMKKTLASTLEYKDNKIVMMSKEEHMAQQSAQKASKAQDKKRKREENENKEGEEGEEPKKKAQKTEMPTGTTLKFEGVKDIEWCVVKDVIKKIAEPRFCNVENGAAFVMFHEKADMEKILEQHKETPLKFGETQPTDVKVLEGEEEADFKKSIKPKSGGGKGKGKKGGKRGWKGRK